MQECKIVSVNMNRQRNSLLQCIRTQLAQFHIICVQEVGFATKEEIEEITYKLQKLSQYKSFWSPAKMSEKRGWKGGVGVILHPLFYENFKDVVMKEDEISRHYLRVMCLRDVGNVHIHGIYGPNTVKEREIFYSELEFHYPLEDTHIVLGDFNEVQDLELDVA